MLRFLGHSGRSPVQGEVKTDRRRRSEGVRVKHWVNQNSVKCYDKGSILRVEATINEPKDFRVWRGPENNPEGKKQWRPLRRSVADLHRRAEVSRAATDRYLTALAAVHVSTAAGRASGDRVPTCAARGPTLSRAQSVGATRRSAFGHRQSGRVCA